MIESNPYLLAKNGKEARDLVLTEDKHAYYKSGPSDNPRYVDKKVIEIISWDGNELPDEPKRTKIFTLMITTSKVYKLEKIKRHH